MSNSFIIPAAAPAQQPAEPAYDRARTADRVSFGPGGWLTHNAKAHAFRDRKALDCIPGQMNCDLSLRQAQVLELLCQGMTVRKISRHLGLSFDTVRTHIKRSYQKLNVANRTAAVVAFLHTRGMNGPETRNSVKFCPSCGCNLAVASSPTQLAMS
jgi:DNA-binding CsgD family transcriptional regulator